MNQTKPTLIFDMDGVILDTEQLVRRCWNEIAPEFHADAIDAVFLTTVGTTRVHTCSILRERYGADFPAEEFNNAVSRRYHVIDDAEGVPVKTGARELLQWARDNAYTIGLASSTRQAVVEKELSERGLLPYFDYVFGGDRIARSKPAPDIYETACRALHAVPADTYAIEDSYNGIRAAHAAGMRPIMVPDLLPPTQEMYTLAAHIFPNLTAFHEFLKRQSTHSLPR